MSDKKLSSIAGLEKTSGKEPDIFAVFFDTPVGVQEAEDATGAVVVIEFKRPGRNDYKTDPAQQVIKRFVEIKHGGVTNIDGRPINATGLRYFGYLVADLTDSLKLQDGRDREAHFPDAWIQAGRFAGTDKTNIVDSVALHGPRPKVIEAAIQFVQKHGLHGFDFGAVRRTDHWSLPPVALREAVINAVVHADYAQRGAPLRVSIFDDRVEVESPGLLPPGLTVDDLRRGVSKLRNRVIGRVFQELGLIEQWGSGIQRISAACRDAGLPPPQLEEIGTRFRVTLSTTRGLVPQLDAIDQAILDALSDGKGRSTNEIASHISRTPWAARTRLAALVARGLALEIGSSPRDPKRRYFKVIQD